jgi:two-component system OmpR family sensor kinase
VPAAPEHTEIGQLSTALNTMLDQVDTAFRQREETQNRLRQFVADASHELRSPAATIRGYAELFRRGAAERPDDLARSLRRIEQEAERMGILVEELLLLARLDQDRPLCTESVDLHAILADAVADARAVESDRPITLDAPMEMRVEGDPDRLRQAVANLLGNVRRHTPPGAPATVRLLRENGRAVVEVHDTGPGLEVGQEDVVFQRFHRSDAARARHRDGSGLGLSIVLAIARAHGGDASVESRRGAGAVFRLTLPAEPPGARPDARSGGSG